MRVVIHTGNLIERDWVLKVGHDVRVIAVFMLYYEL